MPDISFSQLRQLPEAFKDYAYIAEITNIPDEAFAEIEGDPRSLSLFAQTTSIPPKEFSQIEKPWGPHTVVYPGKVTKHGTIDIDFTLHANLFVKEVFENWADLITDNQLGIGIPFDEYTGSIVITTYNDRSSNNSEANRISDIELDLVFPQSVGEIPLDYSGDSSPTLTVTFAYSNYKYKR